MSDEREWRILRLTNGELIVDGFALPPWRAGDTQLTLVPKSSREAAEAQLGRLREAAAWVVDNWDREASQGQSMPALRAALSPREDA